MHSWACKLDRQTPHQHEPMAMTAADTITGTARCSSIALQALISTTSDGLLFVGPDVISYWFKHFADCEL